MPRNLGVLTVLGAVVAAKSDKEEKVGLDEHVDLRRPGVEKFKALPRDQTEG
jgi:hypothetical protein